MSKFLTVIIFIVCYMCTALNAILVNPQNATSYKILYDQFQNFSKNFNEVNFNILGINDACAKQLGAYINGLNPFNGEMQLWAIKMLDAMGKLEPGFLEGNLYSLGSYDECLSIKDEQVLFDKEMLTISGKYCLANLVGGISLGSCVPNLCTASDLNIISHIIGIPLWYADETCQVYNDTADLLWGDIIVIVFLSLVALMAVMSTVYDLYLRRTSEKKQSSIFLSFSLLSNGEKLFGTSTNSDQLECLSGIRTLSMMWIILSHMFSTISLRPVSNLSYMQQFYTDGWTMYIRGGTVSVDSFFLMSGIVLIYVYLKTLKTQNVKFNIFFYYLHRYIRLTPALALVILIQVTLLRHFGSGPIWPQVDAAIIDNCKENWWVNLIYLQNFIDNTRICLNQSWYLAVDTQLFLISPLILIPLRRWKKQTLGFIVVAICASIASSFTFAWTMELHDFNSMLGSVTQEMSYDYLEYIYVSPYNRASPWLIGMLVGYYLYQVKSEKRIFKLNPVHNIVLWICALAVLGTCVFHDNAQYEYERTSITFYIAFVRPAWAIALSWVIVASVTGHGGVVNWFLSLPIFHVLGRLTYALYLIHSSVIASIYLSQKGSMVLSNVAVLYEFWSIYAVCLGVAIILTLLFESPIIVIEKSLKSKPK